MVGNTNIATGVATAIGHREAQRSQADEKFEKYNHQTKQSKTKALLHCHCIVTEHNLSPSLPTTCIWTFLKKAIERKQQQKDGKSSVI